MAILDSALGAVTKIGPYFSSVSLVPAAGFTFVVYLLISAAPWTGDPDWVGAWNALTDTSLSGVLVGALVTVVIAMVLHPLQFALVQVLEGYWGNRPLALRLADTRIRVHFERFHALNDMEDEALDALPSGDQRVAPPTVGEMPWWWRLQEARRALLTYPEDDHDIMPTRLGNILRRHEARAGFPYGLDVVTLAPHLGLVAPPAQLEYLNQQRTQMDLAVRLSLSSILLTIATVILLSPTGWWALLAVVPYGFTYLFYRGACTVAHHYGEALGTILDLNRGTLYEHLGLPPVRSLAEERTQNAILTRVLAERSNEPDARITQLQPGQRRSP